MLGILDKPILYFDTKDIELATMNIKPDTGPGLGKRIEDMKPQTAKPFTDDACLAGMTGGLQA